MIAWLGRDTSSNKVVCAILVAFSLLTIGILTFVFVLVAQKTNEQ